ncbi:hypothetical protein ACRHK7_00470 [Weissella tructae]|uniref:hypothetical protein n=1 Tax=Weissella tructae TaxID=887702 RepID=UPI003D94B4FA
MGVEVPLKDRFWFNRDEASAFMGCDPVSFDKIREDERFKRLKVESPVVRARFSKNNLQRYADGEDTKRTRGFQ